MVLFCLVLSYVRRKIHFAMLYSCIYYVYNCEQKVAVTCLSQILCLSYNFSVHLLCQGHGCKWAAAFLSLLNMVQSILCPSSPIAIIWHLGVADSCLCCTSSNLFNWFLFHFCSHWCYFYFHFFLMLSCSASHIFDMFIDIFHCYSLGHIIMQ